MADTVPPLAPARRSHRMRYAVAALLCLGAVVWMLVLVQRNVVFFETVSQAVRDRAHDGGRSLRIGGAVVPGTIRYTDGGVRFELTQGGATVLVAHTGDEPALFKACAPVVAEGHWDRDVEGTFASTRLLIKHGNDYAPPSDARARCPRDPFGR